MLRKTGLTLAAFVALLALASCEVVFPRESQNHAAGGASGIDAGGTGAGGASGFGAGGASGLGGTGSKCFPSPGQKFCGGQSCPMKDDPSHGCAQSSCSACAVPNAVANCASDGSCGIQSCNAGFSDCNSDAADGCETNTGSDPHNCGGCGHDCFSPGDTTNWLCNQGTCMASNCPTGKGDCNNNTSDGCETDLASDPNNCAFCGNDCSATVRHATPTCANGTCGYSKCDAGWADCDGNATNGCEQDIATDATNCGTCGTVCSGTNGHAACVAGQCTIGCNSGYGDCDGNVTNGCETHLSSNTSHCGSCSVACGNQNGTATCSNGTCSIVCQSGWMDCDANKTNGCETNIETDTKHCGSCSVACGNQNGTATCQGGTCSLLCKSGWGDCDANKTNGCETDLTSPSNCGACNLSCTNGQQCVSGSCQ